MHPSNQSRRLAIVVWCCWLLFGASVVRADFLVAAGIDDSIVRLSDQGKRLADFVPPGSGGLNNPFGMAWAPDGDLYVGASSGIHVYSGQTGAFVRRMRANQGMWFGLLFTPNGDLLATRLDHYRSMERMNPVTGATIATIDTGTGSMTTMGHMLLARDGNVLVGQAALGGAQILRLDLQTNTIAGVFASGGGLSGIGGLAYGPDGMVYAANLYGDYQVRQIDSTSGQVQSVFSTGGPLSASSDLVFVQGNGLWVSSLLNGQVARFNANTGAYQRSVSISYPYGLLHMPEPGTMGVFVLAAYLLSVRRLRG